MTIFEMTLSTGLYCLPVTDSDSLQGFGLLSQVETLATWMRDNEKYWKIMWNMLWNITRFISWKTSSNILGNIIKYIRNKIFNISVKQIDQYCVKHCEISMKNINQSISWNKHVKQYEISISKSWNKIWNIYAQLNEQHLVQ